MSSGQYFDDHSGHHAETLAAQFVCLVLKISHDATAILFGVVGI